MAAPSNESSLDLGVIRQAAENYHEQTLERERKLELLRQNRYLDVESKERLAKRVNRLRAKVEEVLPRAGEEALPAGLRELVERGRIEEDEVTDDLVERTIGETRDFLSVAFLEEGLSVSRHVGRIVTRLGGGRVRYGTGFLVSPRLLLTNHHVLQSEADAAISAVEFDYQLDLSGTPLTVQNFRLDPEAFFLNDKALDFALVAVAEVSTRGAPLAGFGWCPLVGAQGKIGLGESVNIIQHPRGEMKQVVIRENTLVDLPEAPGTVAHYEGDTEPGSSGSPVFNDEWDVVALHHSGVPRMDEDGELLDVDGRVWRKGDDPSRLAWVANEGIRVSAIVDHITRAKLREHEEGLRAKMLKLGEPAGLRPKDGSHPDDGERAVGPPKEGDGNTSWSADHGVDLQTGPVTVTIPLNITVSLGSPIVPQATTAPASAPGEGLLEKIEPDPNYDNRRGYDPNFLGFAAPLPRLMNSVRPLVVEVPDGSGGRGHELKYHHYSVIMNGERRLAFVSAVNLDANAEVQHGREKGGDRWFFDPRIPRECQAGNEFYAHNPLDRGHLTRRADAAWGATKAEAKLANDDTFHFTNCSPQHEVFNQPTKANQQGLLLWGNIEEHIAEQARSDKKKLSIFNGPVFRSNDPVHRGLRVPREFWKIVVFEKEGAEPSALAFLLSQSSLVKDLPQEEFEVGPYVPYQVRVAEIEHKTRLNFGELRTLDPLEQEKNEVFFETGTEAVPLETLRDVVT